MTAAVPGKLIGSGRNADVYDLGRGRVLRRYRDQRDAARVVAEAEVMRHARAAGVPVPEVFDVTGSDIVMGRVTGPTMLEAVARRPWTVLARARQLARLHALVHAVPAGRLSGLPLRPFPGLAGPAGGDVLLHLDLHPQNVLLTADGPVIIDWEGAGCGPAVADIAMTWVIVKFSDVPGSRLQASVVRGVQALFTSAFVRSAGPLDEEWRLTAVRHRLTDPNVRPAEAARLAKLAQPGGLAAGR
jgi:aminoglycoside phosphotransferase (APT) family kinase protein